MSMEMQPLLLDKTATRPGDIIVIGLSVILNTGKQVCVQTCTSVALQQSPSVTVLPKLQHHQFVDVQIPCPYCAQAGWLLLVLCSSLAWIAGPAEV